MTPSEAVKRITAHSHRPASRPGPEVIALSSGDPDFETPDYIREALTRAIESGYTHYINNQGDPELREALATEASAKTATLVTADEVVITHGGAGAITSSLISMINPGDRVLLPEPTYSSYADVLLMIGAEPVFVTQTYDFHLDLDRIRQEAPSARMLVLCHPNNPTGVVYSRQEMEELSSIAEEYDLFIVADEAYESIVFDDTKFTSTLEIPSLRDRLIYCQTFSKRYAMTGWRLGYIIAPHDVAKQAALIHRTINGAGNAAVQRAALVAVTTPSDAPERMRQEYQSRRELVAELLAGTPGAAFNEPGGTFYYFIRVTAENAPEQIVPAALEHGVAIREGVEYGPSGDGHFRITFATDRDSLKEGVLRLRSMINSWNGQS